MGEGIAAGEDDNGGAQRASVAPRDPDTCLQLFQVIELAVCPDSRSHLGGFLSQIGVFLTGRNCISYPGWAFKVKLKSSL
jgi:hypothetical protein